MKLKLSFEIKKYLVNNWNSQLVILVTVGDWKVALFGFFQVRIFLEKNWEYGRVLAYQSPVT